MTKQTSGHSMINNVFSSLERKYPQHKKHLQTAKVYADKAADGLAVAAPYMEKGVVVARGGLAQLKKYDVDQYAPIALGFALCFFGGSFSMLITVVATVQLLCWDSLRGSMEVLYENYCSAMEASRKDSVVDANGDGVADVEQATGSELLSRKLYVFARSVNINEVNSALRTVTAALLSCLAVLRLRFALSMSMGSSLAKMAKSYIPLEPVLHDFLPNELKKWGSPLAQLLFGVVGFIITWVLQRVIVTLHCAVQGADLFVRNIITIGQGRGLLERDLNMENRKAKIMVFVVALVGFTWQVANYFTIPFPLNLIMLPFTIVESFLNILVPFFLAATTS